MYLSLLKGASLLFGTPSLSSSSHPLIRLFLFFFLLFSSVSFFSTSLPLPPPFEHDSCSLLVSLSFSFSSSVPLFTLSDISLFSSRLVFLSSSAASPAWRLHPPACCSHCSQRCGWLMAISAHWVDRSVRNLIFNGDKALYKFIRSHWRGKQRPEGSFRVLQITNAGQSYRLA